MNDYYFVRCAADARREAMGGMYVAGLTNTGVIFTWKPGRARRFTFEIEAACVAHHLAEKYAGIAWDVCHA